jgi:hypothetical protein
MSNRKCNFCVLADLRRKAERDLAVITLVEQERDDGGVWTAALRHPRWVSPARAKTMYDIYWIATFMKLPVKCACD